MGIAALEDKIVQHAVGTVLNHIGEGRMVRLLQKGLQAGPQSYSWSNCGNECGSSDWSYTRAKRV